MCSTRQGQARCISNKLSAMPYCRHVFNSLRTGKLHCRQAVCDTLQCPTAGMCSMRSRVQMRCWQPGGQMPQRAGQGPCLRQPSSIALAVTSMSSCSLTSALRLWKTGSPTHGTATTMVSSSIESSKALCCRLAILLVSRCSYNTVYGECWSKCSGNSTSGLQKFTLVSKARCIGLYVYEICLIAASHVAKIVTAM